MKTRTNMKSGAACYTVQTGDNLSSIAQRFYGRQDPNTVLTLYYSNLATIGPNMNIIRRGQKLVVP